MGYDETLVAPMREELAQLGFKETKSAADVEREVESTKGVTMVVVNSVCGCAAGKARPGIALAPLENFILPGGTPGASHLHVARTVCRRAERLAVHLSRTEPIGPLVIHYLNRLSDALFVMARYENSRKGRGDVIWNSRA